MNEHRAHFVSAQLYQALCNVGWTIRASATFYWVGEAMGSTDFNQLDRTPDEMKETAAQTASNAARLAKLLTVKTYPGNKRVG